MKIKSTKIKTHKTATEIKDYFRTNQQIKVECNNRLTSNEAAMETKHFKEMKDLNSKNELVVTKIFQIKGENVNKRISL